MSSEHIHSGDNKKRKRKIVEDDTSNSFVVCGMYDCLWCDKEKCNLKGLLYCQQCLQMSVGQCKSCAMHSPFQYVFKKSGLCIACDIKRRLKQAKKDNPEEKKRRKDEKMKTKGPSLLDVVRQLKAENSALQHEVVQLNLENFKLKQDHKVQNDQNEIPVKEVYSLTEASDLLGVAMKEIV
jgi:hypothetical protein